MITTLPPGYVPPFTDAEVTKRILYLAGRCFVFIDRLMKRHPGLDLSFDPLVLINVAQSTMDDIWRYKVYHLRDPDKRSDAVKRAAYFTKWIVRFRPIYVKRPLTADAFAATFDKKDKTLLINEAFAVSVALTSIATDVGIPRVTLAPRVHADLLYDLHYRRISEDALIAIYQLILTAAQKSNIVI